MEDKSKITWIEGLRFIAIMMVAIPHFIDMFCPQYFEWWDKYPLLLKGISGKNGVAMFLVIVGFFASKPTSKNLPTYIVQRYLQFTINIFIVLSVFCIVRFFTDYHHFFDHIVDAFKDAFFLRDNLCPTYWCMRSILVGSIICYLLSNCCDIKSPIHKLLFTSAVCVILFLMKYVWVAICILGCIYRQLSDNKFLPEKYKWLLNVICVFLIPILYRHDECNLTYFMQGISCCMTMFLIQQWKFLQLCLGNKVIAYLGSLSFPIFLSHTLVYQCVDYYWDSTLSVGVLAMISLVSLLVLTIQYKLLIINNLSALLRRVLIK